MRFRFLFLNLTVLLLLGIFLPFTALATSSSSINVNIAPENPAPNENTAITLSSYASNLDSVLISWSVNGKTALSGVGKKSFSIKAPDVGKEIDIAVTISLPDGTIDKTIILRPAVMALLWEATDSYAPPFYRGKALPSLGSEIKIVALPEIKNGSTQVNPANMVYSWKQDYDNKQDSSGYGKNYFIYTGDYLESSNNVGVTASTTDQQYSSEKNIDVGTIQPKILFYKNDPKLGVIWEHALSDGYTIQNNAIVQATPYFVSPKDIRIPSLKFNWFINDYQVAVENFTKNLMPLKVQGGLSGTSKIRLEVDNTDKIYESVSREINVNF